MQAFDRAFFEQPLDRKGTFCEKWDDPAMLPPGGIPLWVADMDFPCDPAIVRALEQRASHPCYGYSSEELSRNCQAALCAFWERRHGLTFSQKQCLMLPCVITGLKACVRLFTRPGDRVAMFTPVYGPFYQSAQLNGRQVSAVSLAPDETGRYGMNLSGMERALQDGAKLIMLCNPHNPVSSLWTREELTALAELAEKYDVPIVSDEIHADFVYAPCRFTSILSIEKARNRAVMLCSASKTFNIAGLQQAAAVTFSPEMLSALKNELAAAGVTCGNTFALAATQAAYEAGDAWLDGLIAYLDENRRALADFSAARLPKARLAPAEATYLAWLDLRSYGFSCKELAEKCRRQGVAFTGGTFFGAEGEGFLRVNFGCPRKQLIAGMERLCIALKEDE